MLYHDERRMWEGSLGCLFFCEKIKLNKFYLLAITEHIHTVTVFSEIVTFFFLITVKLHILNVMVYFKQFSQNERRVNGLCK